MWSKSFASKEKFMNSKVNDANESRNVRFCRMIMNHNLCRWILFEKRYVSRQQRDLYIKVILRIETSFDRIQKKMEKLRSIFKIKTSTRVLSSFFRSHLFWQMTFCFVHKSSSVQLKANDGDICYICRGNSIYLRFFFLFEENSSFEHV